MKFEYEEFETIEEVLIYLGFCCTVYETNPSNKFI